MNPQKPYKAHNSKDSKLDKALQKVLDSEDCLAPGQIIGFAWCPEDSNWYVGWFSFESE